ncbi:hypothetical protein LC085_12785 [Bacillus tianshenii]|uniref:hypothetical protein n=1 Tax=Sutcliffiella tianshenii TaxID=1463404 RepID=UPI001CD5FB99|nr:hypothetical protein [Bacillus tianshenii]MCA1320790.1 hypothetical protein [Bacillus tianshenii]
MRHKQRLEEEQLEKLLRQMPRVKDDRDPKQIFREVHVALNKKPRSFNVMPALALAAAILIFAIISPLFLQNMDSSNTSMDQASEHSNRAGVMESAERDDSGGIAEKESVGIQSIDEDAMKSNEESEVALDDTEKSDDNDFAALSDEQPTFVVSSVMEETENVITIGVSAKDAMSNDGAFSFPVSVVVPKTDEESYINDLEKIRYELDYEKLGLSVPHLNDGAVITAEENEDGTKKAKIEVGSLYRGYSSTQSFTFADQVAETFRLHFTTVEYTNNGSSKNVEMAGEVKNGPEDLQKIRKKAYLKYKGTQDGPTFLVLSQKDYVDVQEAMKAMKTAPDQDSDSRIEASVPKTIEITSLQAEDDLVKIVLSPESILENTEETIFALEAMMMTAKEFGFKKVVFETVQSGSVGNVPLNEAVEVPLAPNPISYPR